MPPVFGGGTTKTKVEGRTLTAEERELIGTQVALANEQLRAVRSAMAQFFGAPTGGAAGGGGGALSLAPGEFVEDGVIKRRRTVEEPVPRSELTSESARQAALARPQTRRRTTVDTVETVAARRARTGAGEGTGTGAPSEGPAIDTAGLLQENIEIFREALGEDTVTEQRELIAEAAERAIETGSIDIERFRTEGIEAVRNILAPSRGLRPTDSPIIDRGGEIAEEATRQAGQLVSSVRGQQAEFERALRERAFENRLRLGAALGDIGVRQQQLGLGLATGIPANVSGTLAAIGASQPRTSKTDQPFDLQGIGALAGGGGALLTALGPAGVGLISSRALKEPVEPVDIEALRARVKLLSADWWKWRDVSPDKNIHIGPYAEELHELFGVGDGRSFPIYDAIGLLFALVKALDAKVAP